jgi:uncharacterized DUF497 family protein
MTMDFEWDEAKSEVNCEIRGFSFAVASLIFEGLTVEWCDIRQPWGEVRMVVIGMVEDRVRTVVYTDRDGVRRIISARRARKKEEELWRWCAGL